MSVIPTFLHEDPTVIIRYTGPSGITKVFAGIGVVTVSVVIAMMAYAAFLYLAERWERRQKDRP